MAKRMEVFNFSFVVQSAFGICDFRLFKLVLSVIPMGELGTLERVYDPWADGLKKKVRGETAQISRLPGG